MVPRMLLAGAAWLLPMAGALAQDAPPDAAVSTVSGDAPPPGAADPAAVTGAESYTPADFARFAPQTALDMLRQVPGFSIQRDDDRRGLGQASGNVLINGQRPSGKSNDAVTQLGRVPSGDVVRIDIVDGATLDVPGLTGQVADVIVRSGGVSGAFAYRPQIRARRLPARLTDGEASISGSLEKTGVTVSLENDGYRQGNSGPERLILPGGAVADRRDETLRIAGERPRASLGLKRTSAGGSVANFNGTLSAERRDTTERSLRSGPAQPDRDRLLGERQRERGYEAGGDYEFALVGGRLKLIGLRQFRHESFRQTLTVATADANPPTGDRFTQLSDTSETIGRAEFRWKAGAADWQLSTEGALNSLAVDNALASLDPGAQFVPIALPGSAATVRERRGEAIVSYGRPLAPTLSLQLSAGAEHSTLSQSGAAGLTRSFLQPKGTGSLAWKPSPRLDLSLRLERQVGQLDFGDFVASANLSAGTTDAGNPELVPPQSWRLDLTGTRGFDRYGTLTARLYGRRITDIVDVVPIGADGQAPGNLPLATVYGFEWTSTLNGDPLGVAGAKLDVNLQLQTSSLDDPVTGEHRPISDDLQRSINLDYRQDLAGSDWAYGGSYSEYQQRPNVRLDQRFRRVDRFGNLGLFVENKDVAGLTVRGSVDNVLGTDERLVRDIHVGRRDGPLAATEDRVRQSGPIFTLSITGRI